MDPKFGSGPKELGGAVDLINHFKLWQHHELFCKRSLPPLISESRYLNNVVGNTEIRKGEGMELDQLFKSGSVGERKEHINPFGLDILRDAFLMRESAPIDLPAVSDTFYAGMKSEKGKPTNIEKVKWRKKESEKKCKKHTERDEKGKKHKRHKHHHNDHTDPKFNVQINQQDTSREQLNGPLEKVVTHKSLYQEENKRQIFSAAGPGQKISSFPQR